MGHTCFTVHGQCPGAILGSDEDQRRNSSHSDFPESSANAPWGSWPPGAQFRWQRPARFTSRRPKHQLHVSRTLGHDAARVTTNQPSKRCRRSRLPLTSSPLPLSHPDTTLAASASPTPPSSSLQLLLTLPPHSAILPTAFSAPNASTPRSGSGTISNLQHLALLTLVGPSRLEVHTTAQFLLARAATGLAYLLPASSSETATGVSCRTHQSRRIPAPGPHDHIAPVSHPAVASTGSTHMGAGAASHGVGRGVVLQTASCGAAGGEWRGSVGSSHGAGGLRVKELPVSQLPPACLASVATALVRLPTMCAGDSGWGLVGLFVDKPTGGHSGSAQPPTTPTTPKNMHPQSQSHDHLNPQYRPQQTQPQQHTQLAHDSTSYHHNQRYNNRQEQQRAGLADGGGGATAGGVATQSAVARTNSGGMGHPGTACVDGGCRTGLPTGAVERSVRQGEGGEKGLGEAGEASVGGHEGARGEGGGAMAAAAQQHQQRPKLFDNPLRYVKLLFAGAMSAVVSRTCVAPLERIKMDLLLRAGAGAGGGRGGALDTAAQVLRSEGIAGFWKGNALNVLRTAPFKAVNFFSFDMYHTALLALSGVDGNLERFAAGACAGITATVVCFPLDVVRTRLMAAVAGPCYGPGPFATLSGILRNEGVAALYSGCLPAVIGMAPAGAVFYGVYDMLKHQHLERMRVAATEAAGASGGGGEVAEGGAHPPAAAEVHVPVVPPLYILMYGAMAGAASELIVYPLEVVRRKMQLQSMALAGLRQAGAGGATGAGAGAAAHMMGPGGRLAAAAASHHLLAHPLLGGPGAAVAGGGASGPLSHRALMMLSAAAVANSPSLARVSAALIAILRADGPRGFYNGMLPNMLQVLPSAALSYYTYDTIKSALGAG